MMHPTRECLTCGTIFTPLAEAANAICCSEVCQAAADDLQVLLTYIAHIEPTRVQRWRGLLADRQLRYFMRHIVWQQGGAEFMVCEDYTFATAAYRAYLLTDEPIKALDEIPPAWQEVFWEYALIPLPTQVSLPQVYLALNTVESAVLLDCLTEISDGHLLRLLNQTFQKQPPYAPQITLLSKLAQHREVGGRWTAAAHHWTPRHLLVQLAEDASLAVREAVAQNPSTPREILFQLAKETTLQAAVAANNNLSKGLCKQLAQHPDAAVRLAIANNQVTPLSILRRMSASDEDAAVVLAAKNQIQRLAALR